jgi:hypothetical protein
MAEKSVGGLSTVAFGLLLLTSACGTSGERVFPTDGGHDATGDATPDGRDGAAEVPADGGDDVSAADSSTDAPEDVPVDDASSDSTVDAPSDVALDAAAGDTADDVSPDGTGDDAAGDAAAGGDASGACDPGTGDAGAVAGSHLVFQLDSENAEWVKSLQWLDSTSTLTSNLVGYGGGPGCSSPDEFFGQAFAAPEGSAPYPVGGDTVARLTTCGLDLTIVSQSPDCAAAVQTPVTTVYHFYTGAKADQVRITRTIGFDATTPKSTGVGLRVYVPRLLVSTFSDVLVPNGASTAISTASAAACAGDCFTAPGATWNGKWFADVDPTSGLAMIVLRDPSVTSDVSLTVNSDGNSSSNLSSFVVTQPADGWKAPLTEIEYLCFADLTTWPQTARDAAILPAGCGP